MAASHSVQDEGNKAGWLCLLLTPFVSNITLAVQFVVCEDLGLLLECLRLQNGGVDTQKQVLTTIAAMCTSNSEFSRHEHLRLFENAFPTCP